ncbi:50S ribosomal protein L5 [bacterium]|nr:MAG: 50S ribosomal protein L5 [bacterium]QQR62033.1 MAG: 50S ribosomal protein L5 [bacterium]QQR62372.1 MAG: 50S ribosomal protein L5 [bacterium]
MVIPQKEKVRLQDRYNNTIRPELQKNFGFLNVMQVPRIEKIVVNIGVKDAIADSKVLVQAEELLTRITGQKASRRLARKSNASFKLREGMPIGVMVTLRRAKMYEFLDRLISLALPRIRDFQGVSKKLDGMGNYNLGIKESSIFPEIDMSVGQKILGLNITIQTSAETDEHGFKLLELFGIPFKKQIKREHNG